MRVIPIIVVLGLVLGLFVPGPVTGQSIGPGMVMSGIDTDGDGRISKDEYVAYRDREFQRYDRNGDGMLGQADFPRAASYRRALGSLEAHVARADKNEDGVLSREELRNAPTLIFDWADTSNNGFLSQQEIAAARSSMTSIR